MAMNDLFEDLSHAGTDVLDAVTDALNTNDFSGVSSVITDSVDEFINDIKAETYGANARRAKGYKKTGYGDVRSGSGAYRRAPEQKRVKREVFPFMKRKVSRLFGVVREVLGALGIAFGALPLIMGLLVPSVPLSLLGLAIIIAGGFLLARGINQQKLAKRYFEYGKIIGSAEYYDISKLAAEAGRTRIEVLHDLDQMAKYDMLPRFWYDKDRTTIMLTQEMYDLYEASIRSHEEKQREEEQKYAGVDGSVRKIVEEGNAYKARIRQANDDIADEAMSSKLAKLESIMNRIFIQVQNKPETAPRLRKLMNYYLPTTTKLLDAYIELDRQDEPGENVRNTKREIEDALDTINNAFENLLDSMFQDMAWDISSDISVMKSMLNQDGLTEQELRAGGRPVREEEKKEEEKEEPQVQQLVF